MGVPSFYRWLTNKYPKIVSDAIEEIGEKVDSTSPNPNGVEFDNLYLDMNGIIHPCFHPDDNVFAPTTFEEVFNSIHDYIDRIFQIVRPRKLLYMAIDGVAPRAKMNQQRARRFRTSKDTQIAEEMEDKLRKEFERQGKAVVPKQVSQVADSNVITPGTEFMNMLSKKLQSYITQWMNENPAWKKIKVILSDDTVPGEGEHKIMSFIRAQRSLPGYDPNTRHCLYGLDADLIMLALATHEIHFSILREEVVSPKTELIPEMPLGCNIPKAKCNGSGWQVTKRQPYQFLNLWVLREYLALDLDITSPPEKFEYDLERIIDDFIFICFFAGNDFLPHMPSLEIHEGCIDLLMHVYKKEFHYLGGYLVDMQKVEDQKGEYIKLKRVERFILSVGTYEEKIFCKRSQIREKKLRRFLAEYRDAKKDEKIDEEYGTVSDVVLSSAFAADFDEELKISAPAGDCDTENNTKELKQKLKNYIREQSDLFKDGGIGTDKVKFGTPGWRERYYEAKFSAQSPGEREETRKIVVAKYGEGLCWVLLYYFSGVPSWTWFYPFHYGPFASDLKGLAQTNKKFQKGLPFKPFDQLMGVLPPRSAHALPRPYKMLMTEEQSSIIDFYPTEFQTDVDGKRFMWQGIVKLPFIEEDRLLAETRKLENELKDHEKLRNLQSLDRLFVQCASHGSVQVEASKKIKDAIMMESTTDGVKGTIHMMPEDLLEAVEDNKGDRSRNYSCVFYETHQNFQFVPRLLSGVKIPEKTVDEKDIIETVLWHETYGNRFYQNQRPIIKPNQKQDYSPQNAGPGRGFTNTGRGKTSAASKTVFEIKPGQQIHSGFGGRRVSDSGPQSVFDYKHQPAGSSSRQSGGCATYNTRPDSENVWRKNTVGISSQKDSTKKPFSADTGLDKERGWFQDPRAIIQDMKQNSSTQNVSPSASQGSGCGSNLGGGRTSVANKSVSELQHGTFCRDSDHQPSIPKSEHDGRLTPDSIRRDVYRAPRPLLSSRHEPVGNFWQSREGGAHDTNRDWRVSKPSGANMGGVWKKDFAESSNKMENPSRPFSAYTGRGRGRGRNAT